MRGSVRRRSRGSWELTVNLGRDTDGRRVRRFRTARGTKGEAQRVFHGITREADVGGEQLSPRLLLGILWTAGWRSGCIPVSVLKPAAGMRCRECDRNGIPRKRRRMVWLRFAGHLDPAVASAVR